MSLTSSICKRKCCYTFKTLMQKAPTLLEKPRLKYLFTASFYFVRFRDFLKSLLPLANTNVVIQILNFRK